MNEKINKIAITNEQQEKVRKNSASSLPLNPTAQGWSAQKIREKLYRAICSDTGDLDDNLLDIIVDKLLSVKEVFEALQSGEFVVKKAEEDAEGNNIFDTYSTKHELASDYGSRITFGYDKSTRVLTLKLFAKDDTQLGDDLNITLPLANTTDDGLMSKNDKQNLNTLIDLLGVYGEDDNDNTVNKIREVLDVFENYPEGDKLVAALANKATKEELETAGSPNGWTKKLLTSSALTNGQGISKEILSEYNVINLFVIETETGEIDTDSFETSIGLVDGYKYVFFDNADVYLSIANPNCIFTATSGYQLKIIGQKYVAQDAENVNYDKTVKNLLESDDVQGAIDEVVVELNTLLGDTQKTKNIFDFQTMKKNTQVDGNGVEQVSAYYSATDYIQVVSGKTYVFSTAVRSALMFNLNKELVAWVSSSEFTYFTANANGYIRANLYNPVSPNFVMAEATNLIDFDALLENKVVLPDGTTDDSASYSATDYIKVKSGVKYKLSTNARSGFYYDEDKQLNSWLSQNAFDEFTASMDGYVRLNLYNPVSSSMYLIAETYIEELEPYGYRLVHLLPNKDASEQSVKVRLFKDGLNYYFRSDFGDKDIIIRVNLTASSNKSVNFESYQTVDKDTDYATISGTTFKGSSDDIAPVTVDGGYIGGNHGQDHAYKVVFASEHGLDESNIGEVWEDGNGLDYLIVKIIDETAILVANYDSTNEAFTYTAPTSNLSKDGTILTIASTSQMSILPTINNVSSRVLDENFNEITEDGLYAGQRYYICEKYSVISPKGLYNYLTANVGNNTNDSCSSNAITGLYYEFSCVYLFTEKGAVTLIQNYNMPNGNTGKTYMIIGAQSERIDEYYSVPFSTYFEKFQHTIGTSVSLEKSDTWTNFDYPPTCLFNFSNDMKKGFACGYIPNLGDVKPEIRKSIYRAGYIYTSGKLYPYATINKSLSGGDCFSLVAYRLPFNNFDSNVPIMSWFYQGKDIYVSINCQEQKNTYIKMPDYMIGKKITIIEKDGNITCDNDVVGLEGIKINCTNYGYVMLKVSLF